MILKFIELIQLYFYCFNHNIFAVDQALFTCLHIQSYFLFDSEKANSFSLKEICFLIRASFVLVLYMNGSIKGMVSERVSCKRDSFSSGWFLQWP